MAVVSRCGVFSTRMASSSTPLTQKSGVIAAGPVAGRCTRRGQAFAMRRPSKGAVHGVPAKPTLRSTFSPVDSRKKRPLRKAVSAQAAAGAIAGAAADPAVAGVYKTMVLTVFGQISRMITDPWKPYEIYVIILFFYLLKPVLWRSYELVQKLRGLSHKISDSNFKESFFGFLYWPAYIHGLGMAFNWLMDTIVWVFDSVGIKEHKVLTLISGSDTAVYIVVAGVFLYKLQDYYLDETLDLLFGKNQVDTGMQDLIHRVLELVVILSTFGLASASLGVSKTVITGLYSLLGIGFGFASQEVLQNFFGGLMLVAMQPFTVGDFIQFTHPGGEAEMSGRVMQVGYYQTTLLVEDGSTLSVPNQWFVTVDVTNKSRGIEAFEMRKNQKRALEEKA